MLRGMSALESVARPRHILRRFVARASTSARHPDAHEAREQSGAGSTNTVTGRRQPLPAFFCALVLTCEVMCATLMAASAAPLDAAAASEPGYGGTALWRLRPFLDGETRGLGYARRVDAPPQAPRERQMFKKSETPQWEDLGWAWGKRSGPPADRTAFGPSASLRGPGGAAALVKKTPDWDDLGWAWGRR